MFITSLVVMTDGRATEPAAPEVRIFRHTALLLVTTALGFVGA